MNKTIKNTILTVATIGSSCAFIRHFGKQKDEDNVKEPEQKRSNPLIEEYRWNQFLRALSK